MSIYWIQKWYYEVKPYQNAFRRNIVPNEVRVLYLLSSVLLG